MKIGLALVVMAGLTAVSGGQTVNQGSVTHFVNGKWFDGTRFVAEDFYVEGTLLTKHPDERLAFQTVDLHGGYVVPPYGDAHEHNFDGVYGTAAVDKAYLHDGIFYAQGMTDTTDGADETMKAGLVNTPLTVDVTYAHGGLTGVNGHPKEVYEAIANGIYMGLTPEQKVIVIGSHQRAGKAYWEIADQCSLIHEWPLILAAKPDLIKIYLSGSEHFKQATADDPQLAKGLDPALVPAIVGLAHAAHLKVAAHVDTAHDYHVALTGGVDEMGHLPGYYLGAADQAADFRLTDADVALSGKRHITVQPTASLAAEGPPKPEELRARQSVQIANLRRLKAAGVRIVIGSDHYGQDSLKEANYLQALGLWTNLEMLRMWAVETPQTIFPTRKIAQLKSGYEASFLVLSANPLDDWANSHLIVDRWKQGQHLTP